jgi:hypothetical protein
VHKHEGDLVHEVHIRTGIMTMLGLMMPVTVPPPTMMTVAHRFLG